MVPRGKAPKVSIWIRKKILKKGTLGVPQCKMECHSGTLPVRRRSHMESKDSIMTSRVPPGESPRVMGRTPLSGEKRIRNLFNGGSDRMPKGQKLVLRITRGRERKGTKQFNPTIPNKWIDKPPSNGRNRGERRGSKNRDGKGKGHVVHIPSIQK